MTLTTARHENSAGTVRSSDGTRIGYDRTGSGPPIILVVGAFNDRSTGAPLASFLAPNFSVYCYDRRGRGTSGDTLPYAVERETEDLDALIAEAGGTANVFGYSSGAILALKAAAGGLAIRKLALYEAPFSFAGPTVDHAARLAELIAADRRADAVEYLQTQCVGIPVELSRQLRNAPFWPALEAMAHTLVYDMTIVGDGRLPADLGTSVKQPTLAMDGGESSAAMRAAAQAVVHAVHDGQYRSLPGRNHDIVPEAIGPVVQEFFAS